MTLRVCCNIFLFSQLSPKTYASHCFVHENRQKIDHRRDRVDRLRRLAQGLLVERVERLQLLRDSLVRVDVAEGVLEGVVIALGSSVKLFGHCTKKSYRFLSLIYALLPFK
jgi:hypothetical protein